MVLSYIGIRLRQFWRFFSFNGINPVAGITILALFALLSVLLFEKMRYAPALYTLGAFHIIMQLQQAPANKFLRDNTTPAIFFRAKLAEHMLVALPFIMVLLYMQALLYGLGLVVAIVPYSYFSFSLPKLRTMHLPVPYQQYSFEWLFNFRVYQVAYILHILLLATGVAVNNYYICMLGWLILLYAMVTSYGVIEDAIYIWVFRINAANFLGRKMRALVINYTITFLLFSVVCFVLFPGDRMLTFICLLVGILTLMGSLFMKYQFYPSVFIVQLSQMLLFGFAVASIVSPPFIIAIIAFLLFSYIRARKKVKTILQC